MPPPADLRAPPPYPGVGRGGAAAGRIWPGRVRRRRSGGELGLKPAELGCRVGGGEDRGALAFVGFSYLNLLLLFGAIRRFEASPADGSPARGRARLAVWLLTATLTAAFTWRIGEMVPLRFAAAAWVVAAATVVGGFYMLFLHGDK